MDSISLPEKYQALTAQEPGQRPKIQELPLSRPGKNQVLVKVAVVPINPSDVLLIDGVFRFPNMESPILTGQEGSGNVVAVGEDLKAPHKIGDRVHLHCLCALGQGTFGQYSLLNSEDCSTMEGNISFEEGAPHIVNPGTVGYMGALVAKGGHKAAIITAASSAIGRMLTRYLRYKGVKTINIVRQDKYIEELKGEGADYVLNSEWADFESQLKEIAAREEATIAFDAINGDFISKITKNQPPNSICYVYGTLGAKEVGNLFKVEKLEDGKTVSGLLYLNYIQELKEKGELENFYREIHSLLPTVFKTNVAKVFSFEEFQQALDYYKTNASKGKVLIKIN